MDKILTQLVTDTKVFDYIAGQYHKTFKGIHPHISSHLDTVKLTNWIKQTRNSIVNRQELKFSWARATTLRNKLSRLKLIFRDNILYLPDDVKDNFCMCR